MLRDQRLDAVAPRQQLPAVNPQLGGQMFRGDALGNPAQDLYNRRTVIMTLGPDRPGEEVEDRPAGAAALVQDGGTMAIMGSLIAGQRVSTGTAQPVWVQHLQQEVVAGLLI